MVALLASQNLKVVVLFDDEPQACNAAEDLLKNKLIRDENLAFVTDGFDEAPSEGADVENLVDAKTFGKLVSPIVWFSLPMTRHPSVQNPQNGQRAAI